MALTHAQQHRASGSWRSGLLRVAVVALGACALAGCATARSAQEQVGGWFGSTPEAAAEPAPAASQASPAKKVVRKPAVAAGPNATPKSVDEPAVDEASEPSESDPEMQAPEQTIFDPY